MAGAGPCDGAALNSDRDHLATGRGIQPGVGGPDGTSRWDHRRVAQLTQVEVPPVPLAVYGPVIGEKRQLRLVEAGIDIRRLLEGQVLWNVSSTACGGGVAEMLRVLLGYVRGAGIDARWVVIQGDPRFFAVTKRVHNRIHGQPGDGGPLGPEQVGHYEAVTEANAKELAGLVSAGDVVILHDPQTAGMVPTLRRSGARVIWRSHIGIDRSNETSDSAWRFLEPYLSGCDAFVFTRRSYVPEWIPPQRVAIIPPSIDPFSPKNQAIADADLPVLLAQIGLIAGPDDRPVLFTRSDGTTGAVRRRAEILSQGGPLESLSGLVVQVSRWDRLKDMLGVLEGFVGGVIGEVDASLALVGPAVEGVTDDPEGVEVMGECVARWWDLPPAARRRVRLVTLPLDDVDENALMVNALQRAAQVIVQKSLMEGFGLTVAEGMWKAKPVLASAVGGIVDQMPPGTGILLEDPSDLDAFAGQLVSLLVDPDRMGQLGSHAYRHVLDQFVGDLHLLRYAELIEALSQV